VTTFRRCGCRPSRVARPLPPRRRDAPQRSSRSPRCRAAAVPGCRTGSPVQPWLCGRACVAGGRQEIEFRWAGSLRSRSDTEPLAELLSGRKALPPPSGHHRSPSLCPPALTQVPRLRSPPVLLSGGSSLLRGTPTTPAARAGSGGVATLRGGWRRGRTAGVLPAYPVGPSCPVALADPAES